MDNIQSVVDSKSGGIFSQLEQYFADIFLGKIPPLPPQIRDLLAKLAPFWAICMIAFALLQIVFGSLAVLLSMLNTFLSIASFSRSGAFGGVLGILQTSIGLALGVLILIYLGKSLRNLFNLIAAGWQSLFRAEVVSLFYSCFSWVMTILISLSTLDGYGVVAGIGSSIVMLPVWLIMFGVSFYLLFQIRDRYV
jgi:hypothetical protein